MSEEKFFDMPVEVTKDFGGKLMEHALCDLQEVVGIDDGCELRMTYCKDHGLSFVYESNEHGKPKHSEGI